jgi:hypothetical protein
MLTYDQWKCSGGDYPGDCEPEYDEDDDMEHVDNVQDAIAIIKDSNARELRLLTAAVSARREQLERELKAELSELGNVDKAPRAPRSDKGKPRKLPANDTAVDDDTFEVAR